MAITSVHSTDSQDDTTAGAVALLLHPRSVALIGASTNPNALGGRPLGFLASYGFEGRVYPVNPAHDEVQGRRAYPAIRDVPEQVDVAMIAVRAHLVPQMLRECAEAGVRVAIVMSSGFGEGTGQGAELSEEIAAFVATTSMRVLGPNCEGVASLPAAAPLTFSPVLDIARTGRRLQPGNVAVVSQSGGMGYAVAEWGAPFGVAVNYVISTGNEIDIDAVEVATHLVDDETTTAVVLLVEGLHDLEGFATVAKRAAATGKRMVVAKLGQTVPGTRGAAAHTRHDTGDPERYRELFQAQGVLAVRDEEDLIDVLQAVTKSCAPKGRRLGIMTTSGGAGVWLSDACAAQGFEIPVLSTELQRRLAAFMPSYGSPVNPVDLTAQFITGGAFAPALDALLGSGEVDAVILATSLSSSGRLDGDRSALAELRARYPGIPLLVYSYTHPATSCVEILEGVGLPWYTTSARAARGLAALAEGVH